ncbi:hypothetical protein K8352_14335 [Flavobacteriaceae bacterium F89]|uniref:Uncharacterized protein n=1 Tax=Cerina litoralis TaxID=2874477 RepID=A0AAE3EXG9_9FLAO|nr:hypothetical protein [Cerina litoralis]MCG2461934.1 hypothetical protein [Cerina litoralis]
MSSTDQHGVHSPFVYDFVTQCLYQKRLSREGKVMDVLLKSLAYFKSKNVLFVGVDARFQDEVLNRFPSLELNLAPYDFIYIDILTEENMATYIIDKKGVLKNTVVLVKGIHGKKEVETLWEGIKNAGQTRVTLDFFYGGLIFFREGQAKEHFKIRI